MKNINIIILTGSFPYSFRNEKTFLSEEIKVFNQKVNNVILMPLEKKGVIHDIPKKVKVELGLSKKLHQLNVMLNCYTLLKNLHFFNELKNNLFLLKNPKQLARMILCLIRAQIIYNHCENYLKTSRLKPSNTIFYSFWFDASAVGLGLLKKYSSYDIKACVSKAHGGDLYFERNCNHYIPFRGLDIAYLDLIFPDSETGTKYLKSNFPDFKKKFQTSRLGTIKTNKMQPKLKEDQLTFNIVSCSYLVKIKRVDLIIKGLNHLSKQKLNKNIFWHHFGGGPLLYETKKMAFSLLSDKIKWKFHGNIENENIISWYQSKKVNAFINVSKSEGTAVSIMEAMSFGIPLILSSVGGNKEMITSESGILLKNNPKPEEISNALKKLILSESLQKKFQNESFNIWKKEYSAKNNFTKFLNKIVQI